jgi:hypothetical protein
MDTTNIKQIDILAMDFEFDTVEVKGKIPTRIIIGFAILHSKMNINVTTGAIIDINPLYGVKYCMALSEEPHSDFWKRESLADEYKSLLHPKRNEITYDDVLYEAHCVITEMVTSNPNSAIVTGSMPDLACLSDLIDYDLLKNRRVIPLRLLGGIKSENYEKPYTCINKRSLKERSRRTLKEISSMANFYSNGSLVKVTQSHDCAYDTVLHATNYIMMMFM